MHMIVLIPFFFIKRSEYPDSTDSSLCVKIKDLIWPDLANLVVIHSLANFS